MTPLYNSYKLTNSTEIPLYAGSANPESLQVSQIMQQRYDAAKQGANGILQGSMKLTGLGVDQKYADEMLNKTKMQDIAASIASESLLNGKYILAQKGKKNYYLVKAN